MNNVLQSPLNLDIRDSSSPIVMVDDEEIDFELAERFYKRSGLLNPFIHFLNGAAFIAYLDTVKKGAEPMPAAVLMDINMPRMNGFETLETLRAEECFRNLPVVILLTSSDDPHDRSRAATSGADGYLLKPYNPKRYLDFFSSLNKK